MNIDKFLDECLCHDIQKAKQPAWVKLQMKHEKVLAARMLNSYNNMAKEAISEAGKLAFKGKSASVISKTVSNIMNVPFTKKVKGNLSKDIIKYYVADRKLSAKEFDISAPKDDDSVDITKAEGDDDIQIVFDIRDKEIVKLINEQNLIAAQSFYNTGLSKHVVDVITKLIRTEGLSRTQIKLRIEKELALALGLKKGISGLKDLVPKDFRGTSKDYYTGLAQTTLTRGQTAGRIQLFSQGTFTTFIYSAIIDKRTSEICLSLNGRIFTIEQGQEHVDNILGATTTEELKKVAGWRRDLSEFGITRDQFKTGPRSAEISKTLADAGLSVPPAHYRCRSTIQPHN